jgi:hypothetical protein
MGRDGNGVVGESSLAPRKAGDGGEAGEKARADPATRSVISDVTPNLILLRGCVGPAQYG